MPMNDMFKADRQRENYSVKNNKKRGGFATRFVTQLMVAGLIFVVILVCYQKDNPAGEAVRYVVAMATADQSEYLAVNGLFEKNEVLSDDNSPVDKEKEANDNNNPNAGTGEEWDKSAAYTVAADSGGKIELLLPASGVLMKSFGEVTSAGAICQGLIITCESEQQVKAAAAGTVIEVTGSAGDYQLRVQHTDKTTTLYDGLHTIDIAQGVQLRQGDVLGKMLAGKNLHFAVLNDGKPVDPLTYLQSPAAN